MSDIKLTRPSFEWLKKYNNPNHISTVVGNITILYKDNGTSIMVYNHTENVYVDLDTIVGTNRDDSQASYYSFFIVKDFIEISFEGDIPLISINKERLPFGC